MYHAQNLSAMVGYKASYIENSSCLPNPVMGRDDPETYYRDPSRLI